MQRSFVVTKNKPFTYAGGVLFKNTKVLFTLSNLVLKNIARCISLPVRLDQELKKVLQVDRIGALSMLPMYVLKLLTFCFDFLY